MNSIPYVLAPQNLLLNHSKPVIFWSRYADDALDGAISYFSEGGWQVISYSETRTDDQAAIIAFQVSKNGREEVYFLRNALIYIADGRDD